jgi:hypothetical protein
VGRIPVHYLGFAVEWHLAEQSEAGSRVMHIQQGAYHFGPSLDPHKTLYMQMVDPQARTAVVLRAHERIYSIDKARVLLGRVLDSLARNDAAMPRYFSP